jgi:hydroxymethylbilane synthase
MDNLLTKTNFKVGTRGSLLAVEQTKLVLSKIKEHYPEVDFEIITIKTSGDLGLLQELGAFVKEVEHALTEEKIDFAVHSLKDMPTTLPDGLVLASILPRGDVRDCLVSRHQCSFYDLPQGAKIGTSSLRRKYQLNKLRSDIEVVLINGNIITRMEKTFSGELDGVILAYAGLNRVNMSDKACYIFSVDEIIPAVGQGALALETRNSDDITIKLLSSVDDNLTRLSVDIERDFLSGMGGGCRMPMGAFAYQNDNQMEVKAFYSDGTKHLFTKHHIDFSIANQLGIDLATKVKYEFNL